VLIGRLVSRRIKRFGTWSSQVPLALPRPLGWAHGSRAKFLEALATCLDPALVAVHFGKRCLHITDSKLDQIELRFEDGTTHPTDVLIGADGIKSTVRHSVIGEEASDALVFTNTQVYRGLIPVEELKREGMKTDVVAWPTCWFGQDKVRMRAAN